MFEQAGAEAGSILKEFTASPEQLNGLQVGGTLGVDMFKAGQKVDVTGVTIGKVSAIDLDRDSYTGRVTMDIEKQVNNLPIDSTASILTAGLLGEKYIGISVGGEEEVLADGGQISDTQSALVLEDLIGKFLLNSVNKEEGK